MIVNTEKAFETILVWGFLVFFSGHSSQHPHAILILVELSVTTGILKVP